MATFLFQQAPGNANSPYSDVPRYETDADEQGIKQPQTQQAILRTDCEVDRQALKNKAANSGNQIDVIPGGNQVPEHNIYVGDIVLFPNVNMRLRQGGPATGLAVLNGESHADCLTARDFMAKYTVGGPAITDVRVDKSYEPKLKLGLSVGGSFTIINRSGISLRKGDIVKVRMPYFDKLAGEFPDAQWLKRRRRGGKNSTALKVEIELYDPRNVNEGLKQIFYRAYPRLQSYLPLTQLFDVHSASPKPTPLDDLVSAAKLAGILHALLSGVKVLGKRGIVQVMTPQKRARQDVLDEIARHLEADGNSAPSLAQWNAWKQQLNQAEDNATNAETCANMRFDEFYERFAGRKQGASIENDEIDVFDNLSSADQKEDLENDLLWLAHRLGVVQNMGVYGSGGFESGRANEKWVRDLLITYFYKYVPASPEFEQMRNFYSPAPFSASSGRIGGLSRGAALHSNNPKRQLERFMTNAADIDQSYYNIFVDEERRHILGEVLYASEPMQPLTINRSVHV